MATMTIISFGHDHATVPSDAHLAVDLREGFLNPAPHLPPEAVFPHPGVRTHVLATPGLSELIDALAETAHTLATVQDEVVVAVGCAGGHHRAPSVAAELGARLAQRHHTLKIQIAHRDLHTDVQVRLQEPP